MQVNVLGAFHVVRGTQSLVPSAPKLRQVLALLAMNANTVVSTDQIIEELWEERPPSSATTTLQTYVYHLRKLYQLGLGTRGPADSEGDTAPPTLHRSSNGYILSLDDGAVDSAEFLRLAERARTQLDAGSVETAADTIRSALQLWRGPALVDVTTGSLLRAMTVWLEEQRRGLTLQRIDADLRLCRHHDIIGELTGMVAQRPTDESLQARLMLSLYRAGRRFDALRVYQKARSTLAEELGLEPMQELQRVHQAVLLADPTIEPPMLGDGMDSVIGGGTRPATPEQPDLLPPDVGELVGRRAETAQITQVISRPERSAAPAVVVVGAPGVGKSTLCVHLAHRLREDYPDGRLHARLTDDTGRPVDPAEVLGGFLRAAGYTGSRLPESLAERSSLFRSWSAGRRVLVVLDDVVGAEQLQHLLPTGPRCATLIAARRRFSHPSVSSTVNLRPFDRGEALQMLTSVLGEQRLRPQLAAVHELVDLCEGLPAALREAVTQLELKPHWPVQRQVERLRSAAAEQHSGDSGPGTSRSVRLTYRLLTTDLQAAFQTLVGSERALPLSDVATLLEADEYRTETVVEELVEFGLVEVAAGDRGDFHYRVQRPFRRFFPGPRTIAEPPAGGAVATAVLATG
ncbi:AfsR/SARP family transcriptional regulator [Couchioplanes azureus]|uniref:AfsR/SARP family transcriptional regulator n=1 Tax=Couchioplanes caeruleus TaxID=56438 RepID=UPI0016702BCF|nr:AfsR/SARP family transcriptional regulator [Couchioplanes caeruleus]GGQ80932.1 SARP family transcriptional regulator [Couchioplanes caeruleus subsp. azureus]